MKTAKKAAAFIISFAVIMQIFVIPASAYDQKKLDAAVAEIMKLVKPGMSDFEKVTVLHDWMIENVRYDYSFSKYSVYNALVEHSSVCQGYADGFQLLLNKAGIVNKLIAGGDHEWNLVKLYGNWYHVDTTWDAGAGSYGYTYFLLSDKAIGKNHEWNKNNYPATPATSFGGTNSREVKFIRGNYMFYNDNDKESAAVYNAATMKTVGLTNSLSYKLTHKDNLIFFCDIYYNGKLVYFNTATGKKTTVASSKYGLEYEINGNTVLYYNKLSKKVYKHSIKTGKSSLITSDADNMMINGDYMCCSLGGTTLLYGIKDDKKFVCGARYIDRRENNDGDIINGVHYYYFVTVVDGIALFADYDGTKTYLYAYNLNTQTIVKEKEFEIKSGEYYTFIYGISNGAESNGEIFKYIGINNGVVYFHSQYDVYSYNVNDNAFKKLRRPDGIATQNNVDFYSEIRYLHKAEIIKKDGKIYLVFFITGYDSGYYTDKEGNVSQFYESIRQREIK